MGVLGRIFGRRDNRRNDGEIEHNNGANTTQGGKVDIDRKFVRETARTMNVEEARESIVPDIQRKMREESPDLWRDYNRVMRKGTEEALAVLTGRRGKTANPPQMEVRVGEAEIEMQRQKVRIVEERLELMKTLPEIYTENDIAEAEEELRIEQSKLDGYIGADSGKTMGDSKNELDDDGWNQEWIEWYDTHQESALKRIMQELKESEYMDEDAFNTMILSGSDEDGNFIKIPPEWEEFDNRHEKISSVYKELEQILAKCKQRRRELKTTKDPETNERKPDRFGNATELTPMEFATLKIEELIREGIIEPEIAAKCNIYIGNIGRDDDDDDLGFEIEEDAE